MSAGVAERDAKALYDREGYVGPYPAFDAGELERSGLVALMKSLRARAAEGEAEWMWGRNRHLDVPAVARACRNTCVVNRVQEILGPDLVLWRSQIFAFSTRDMGMGWHRDEYETCLDVSSGGSHCSVQIALVTSTRVNRLAIVPRSHTWDAGTLRAKGCTPASNVLYREWNIPPDAEVRAVPMKAGEIIVFHPGLLHASVWGRTLRVAGMGRVAARLARGSRTLATALAPTARRRYAMTLRIATASTPILPEAFMRTPTRSRPVRLVGAASSGSNPAVASPEP